MIEFVPPLNLGTTEPDRTLWPEVGRVTLIEVWRDGRPMLCEADEWISVSAETLTRYSPLFSVHGDGELLILCNAIVYRHVEHLDGQSTPNPDLLIYRAEPCQRCHHRHHWAHYRMDRGTGCPPDCTCPRWVHRLVSTRR